jgi:hypothetical protein
MRMVCQRKSYKVNGGNFMAKEESLLFSTLNAATMSL